MIDVEFQILSDRREGLLLELGRVVMSCGFTLLRPHITTTNEGIMLVLATRGPEKNLLALQDRLSSNHLVRNFEANILDPVQRVPVASSGTTPTHSPPPPTTVEENGDAASTAPYLRRVETLLGELARKYPNILSQVVAFEREMPPQHREASSRYAGRRLGAWMFKRDYALGARLDLPDSVRQIALPAMRSLIRTIELADGSLHIKNSPFCGTQLYTGASCHFFRGCLDGLLGEPGHLGRLHIAETFCRNAGAEFCTFTFTTVG